jgi:hypothetical protein
MRTTPNGTTPQPRVNSCCVQRSIDAAIGIGDSFRRHKWIAGPGEDRTPDSMVANFRWGIRDRLRRPTHSGGVDIEFRHFETRARPRCSKSAKGAGGFCKMRVCFVKMLRNSAKMSPSVSG